MSRSPVKSLPYSDVFDQVMFAFDQQLVHFFNDRDLTVVPVTNDNQLSEATKKTNQGDSNLPLIGRRYNTIEELRDQRNSFLLRLDGLAKKDKAGNWFIFRLTPLRISLTLNFMCLDEKDLRLFAQRWMDCSTLHYLDFNLNFHDNPLKIRVDCDPSITYPEQEENTDTGQMFNCEVTCSVVGYMGSITPAVTIKTVNVHTYSQGFTDPDIKNPLKTRTYNVQNDGLYCDGIKMAEKPK